MSKRLGVFIPVICLMAACSGGSTGEDPIEPPADVDTDGDGLFDSDEDTMGLNPNASDTDEDGLGDGEEIGLGTDPLEADSDNDGYLDGDEIHEGSDPLLRRSKIYAGGWPYNREKDALNDPTFAGPLGAIQTATQFPDLVGIDQNGELVHLYDFANHGVPVMLDFSAQWCAPCNALADFMTGANNSFPYTKLREALQNGDLYWVTVLGQNFEGDPATAVTSTEWADLHPDDLIPVLSPPNPHASLHYINLHYFPTMLWLDETMNIVSFENDPNPYAAADALEAELQ